MLVEAHVANVPYCELWHYRLKLNKLCGGSISTGVVIKNDCERAICEG